MRRLLVLPAAVVLLILGASPASAVSGAATASTACVEGHVALTVVATLPASSAYVRYTAFPVGVFDLGTSTRAGVWLVWVTRRSGRVAESYLLQARYAATECAL